MEQPLLSIVIANYNYGRFLEDAIESVISQDMGNQIELIICDAASTDNSLGVIKKYANGLPPNTPYEEWRSHDNSQLTTPNSQLITWWCSEKDGGQSAAFNKGFAHAKGRFLTWLNADDIMLPGTLQKLKLSIEGHPECEWFIGGVVWLDPTLHVFKCGRARQMSRCRASHGLVNVCGPSSFFSKSLFERAGRCDEKFQYTMDSDLWLRFAIGQHVSFRPFVKYAWGLRLHSDAKMSGHKITPEGKILEGKDSRDAFERNVYRQNQLKKERTWTCEKLGIPKKQMPWFMQRITADYIPAILSRVDTWRYKGLRISDINVNGN